MGARVLVLGVAYKSDIDDVRESPALLIIEQLRKKGADVVYNDPHIPDLSGEIEGDLRSIALSEEELARTDCAVVVTAHSAYDWGWIAEYAGLVVDTRNALAGCRGKARVIGL
jgi:UDP-N-acetyl-D-glucosamine dehydrogenase